MEELQIIQNKIYEVRGQKVMLDFDLAKLYNVETKALKQAVRRNIERFPADFRFTMTENEWQELVTICDQLPEALKHSYILPDCFTEQGVSMLSSVLRSKTAIAINVSIMRAFVTLRNQIVKGSDIAAEVERKYGEQLEALEKRFDKQQQEMLKMVDKRFAALKSELSSMDRQYFSLLDRQLFWESQHPGVDHFAPPLYLDMATWVDEYSSKAVVIFTVRKDDRFLLKGIGARFNPWLTHQGRKCAGWIFPKSQVSKLVEILPQGYDMRILKEACGDAEFVDKICKGKKK